MKGRIISTGRAVTGKMIVTVEIDGDIDAEGAVEIKPLRKKRSLSANAYFYVLITKMAEKLRTSVNEVHNMMISRYGYPEIVGDNLVTVPLKEDIDPNKLEGIHLKSSGNITTNSRGTRFVYYYLMRGSHTFNTQEMAHLIDGVISEAKELGIDTLTPEEKERMMAAYEKHHT